MKKSAIQKNRDARVKAEADKVLRQVAAAEVLHDLNAGRGSIDDARVAKLVEAALADYRKRFPSCPVRQPRAWLFYDGEPSTKRIRGTPDRVDVYCTFCRVLLVNRAVWQRDYTDELRYHTTICALRCLAGQMEPARREPTDCPRRSDMSESPIVASKAHVDRLLREADTICRGDRAKVFGLLLQSLAMHIGGSEGWDPLLAMAIEMLTNTRAKAQKLFGSVKA